LSDGANDDLRALLATSRRGARPSCGGSTVSRSRPYVGRRFRLPRRGRGTARRARDRLRRRQVGRAVRRHRGGLRRAARVVVASKVSPEQAAAVTAPPTAKQSGTSAPACWSCGARLPPPPGRGVVGVLAGGTSDTGIADEASSCVARWASRCSPPTTSAWPGAPPDAPAARDRAAGAGALIVAAGMEGALPSVVAGLVEVPVIGLPCRPVTVSAVVARRAARHAAELFAGLVVVNIDNGVGAGVTAASSLAGLVVRRLAMLLRDRRDELHGRWIVALKIRSGRSTWTCWRAPWGPPRASRRRRPDRAVAGRSLRSAGIIRRIESETAADAARRGALGFDLMDVIAGVQQVRAAIWKVLIDALVVGDLPAFVRRWTRCSRSTPSSTCWCASRCAAFSKGSRGRRRRERRLVTGRAGRRDARCAAGLALAVRLDGRAG